MDNAKGASFQSAQPFAKTGQELVARDERTLERGLYTGLMA
jgi:hypothetical protein